MSDKKQAEPQAASAVGLIAGTDIPVFKGADGKYEVIGDPRNEVSANHLGDALREFFSGSFGGEAEEKHYAYSDAAWNAVKANIAKDEHAHDFGPGHIVFSDLNLEDGSIDYCLEQPFTEEVGGISREQYDLVMETLKALQAVPFDERVTQEYRDEMDALAAREEAE